MSFRFCGPARRVAAACAVLVIPAVLHAAKPARTSLSEQYGRLPLHFEANKGQTDPAVKYLSRGGGFALLLSQQQAALSLLTGDRSAVVKMNFLGSRPDADMRAEAKLPGVSNYMIGDDRSRWVLGSQHYGKVVYERLYPGIDAVFYGNQRQLEYDFVVAPGADLSRIRLGFEGVAGLRVDAHGNLVLRTGAGELVQKAPIVYQETAGKRRTIAGRYVLRGGEVGFHIARYDRSKPLVIDPVLLYSTFLGGSAEDEVRGVTLDANRAAVVVGRTASTDFAALSPTGSRGAGDAFLLKLGVNGNTVIHATYFGGAQDDGANDVTIDANGNPIVVGFTNSGVAPGKFPVTGSHQNDIGGLQDGFVVKFNPGANTIVFSTFIGGFQNEDVHGVATDASRNVYAVGYTASTNFASSGGLVTVFQGGATDGFLYKFNADGQRIMSTYLGGEAADVAHAVAVDAAGSAYVTGETFSTVFPKTAGAFQTLLNGCTISPFNCAQNSDAFVAKFVPAANALAYSTYVGGRTNERGKDIVVDADGNAYITGDTDSNNMPVLGAFQPVYAGGSDAFVAKLNPTGTNRIYLSYIGGTGDDRANSIALDSTRSALIVGHTGSTNFPVNNFYQNTLQGTADAFFVIVNPAGDARTLSTYLGAEGEDVANSVAVDATGNAYIGGRTTSVQFPTLNPVQASFAGAVDGFVTKISNCTISINPTQITVSSGSTTSVVTIGGTTDCPWTASTSDNWITFNGATSGVGPGFLSFNVAENASFPRVGTINIGGQIFTVTQQGTPIVGCVYPPNPQNVIVLPEGTTSTFLIQTSATNCQWQTSSNVSWLQPFPLSGTGAANIQYTVFPNFSTLVRVGDIMINGQMFRVTQAGTALTANQRFVALVYFNFLGRYPSQAEIDFQASQLSSGVSRADLVMNFYQTAEFNNGGRFVAGLYYGLLARDPEFGGWLFQRNALARGGISQQQLVANFLGSAEFFNKYGAPSDAEFVRILYRNILGREALPDEVTFHVATIPALGRVQVAVNFLNSTEFRSRIDARLTAFLLYATLLGRDANSTELATRQAQIQSGVPVRTLVDQFANSAEFLLQIL